MRVVGLVWKAANQLYANPANFRRHPNAQREALRGILGDVGFAGAVMENITTGNLIDGHARVEEVLSINEHEPLPVLQVEMSADEELKLLASYDPIGAMATVDREALAELLTRVNTKQAGLQALLADLAAKNGLNRERMSFGAPNDDGDGDDDSLSDAKPISGIRFPLAITVDKETQQRWKRIKEQLVISSDSVAFIELLNHYEEHLEDAAA